MTKKEMELIEDLKIQLALKYYPEVLPDIKPPDINTIEEYSKIINGYSYNIGLNRIEKACTTSINHGIGKWDHTDRRDSINLYSTKKLAYMALLHEMSKNFAKELRYVELKMEKDKII